MRAGYPNHAPNLPHRALIGNPAADAGLRAPCGTPDPSTEDYWDMFWAAQINTNYSLPMPPADCTECYRRSYRAAAAAAAAANNVGAAAFRGQVTIPVYVNIIQQTDGTGATTDAQVARFIELLNDAFAAKGLFAGGRATRYTFRQCGRIVRTTNDAWFTIRYNSASWIDMTNALYRGAHNALNLYFGKVMQDSNERSGG